MQVMLTRWGNGLGLPIPKEMAATLQLSEGAHVDVVAQDDRLVVTVARPRYRLDDLLAGMTPETMADAFDWGPDVGREIIE